MNSIYDSPEEKDAVNDIANAIFITHTQALYLKEILSKATAATEHEEVFSKLKLELKAACSSKEDFILPLNGQGNVFLCELLKKQKPSGEKKALLALLN